MDDQSKLRLITTKAKVPAVISYLTKKNPNEKNSDTAPDILATDLNAASKEYIKWVKDSLTPRKKEGEEDKDTSDIELSNLDFY